MSTNTNVSAQTVKQAASPPATGYVPWPIEESNPLTIQRSFVDDLASRSQPCRPVW